MKFYLLKAGEETPLGPFEMDEIKEFVARGEVDKNAKVVQVGGETWTQISDNMMFGHLFASAANAPPVASAGQPAQVKVSAVQEVGSSSASRSVPSVELNSSPKQRKAPPKLALGAVAGVLGIAALGAGGWYAYKTFASSADLPLELSQMPSSVTSIVEERLYSSMIPGGDRDDLYRAASLGSNFCRPEATNPAFKFGVMGAYNAEEVLSKESLQEAHEAMKCGADLLKKFTSDNYMNITFKYEDDRRKVSLFELDVDKMPAGYERHRFGSIEGFCYPSVPPPEEKEDGETEPQEEDEKPPAKECHDASQAAFKHDGRWLLGRRDALSKLSKSIGTPRDEPAQSVQWLSDGLGPPVPGLNRIAGKPDDDGGVLALLSGLCVGPIAFSAGESDELKDACMPDKKDFRQALEALDGKIRAGGIAVPPELHPETPLRIQLRLVARDAEEAEPLMRELKEIVEVWQAHVANNAAKLEKLSREKTKSTEKKRWAGAVSAYLRAVEMAEVNQDGNVLVVALEAEYKESERAEMNEVESKLSPERKAVAGILQDLLAGPKVSMKALTDLAGSEWATWLLAPKDKFTEKELLALQEKANAPATELFADDVSDEERTTVVGFQVAASTKKDSLFPADYRACLNAAKDWRALLACPEPEAPDPDKFGPEEESAK